MRAAITGGAGFIGSNIVDALVANHAEVLVLDDLSHGSESNLARALRAGARLAVLDIRDGERVRTEFADFAPEVVFHLAAQIDVRTSMDDPAKDAAINVLGSVNVFDAARRAGARRIVNTSTGGAMYGVTDLVPTPETAPAAPVSGYGLSKRTAERYAAWFRASHGMETVTLRYGNVYGPRQDPHGDAGVIAIFCNRVLTGARPTVFGDGTQTRDFVFVGDIVAANLAAARVATLPHEVYNVGTGDEISVLELVAAVAEAAGIDPADFIPNLQPARPGELLRSCLDVRRAHDELGVPPPTPLVEGLAATLAWVRELEHQ